jgi:hypothetical protein
MQTLDSNAGAADAARRARANVVAGNCCVTLGFIPSMDRSDHLVIEFGFDFIDCADRLDATHRLHELVSDQVVAGWHRCAVGEKRRVTNDHWVTGGISHDDLERPARLATQQFGDAFAVSRSGRGSFLVIH